MNRSSGFAGMRRYLHCGLRAVGESCALVGVLMVMVLLPGTSMAAGDAAAGKSKAATCAGCHGLEGRAEIDKVTGQTGQYPKLAGQYESYLIQSLKNYRAGIRENAIMAGFATALSDQDIADLAAWFASQDSNLRTAPK